MKRNSQLLITTLIVILSLITFFIACNSTLQGENLFVNSTDIGDCKLHGALTYDPVKGVYMLTGSGKSRYNEDAFYFAWKEIKKDFILSSNVAFKGKGNREDRNLGLQIRETLDADSRYVSISLYGNGTSTVQYRNEKGGPSNMLFLDNSVPKRLQLERKDSFVIVRTGIDTISDKMDYELRIELPSMCYVGLFVGSQEENILESGYFSNLDLKLPEDDIEGQG